MELKQFKIAVLPLRDKLLSYARKLTDDHSDAEDAVQEVMLKLWNLRPKLDEYHTRSTFCRRCSAAYSKPVAIKATVADSIRQKIH